ncbi:flagellar basal body rod protein FlgB [Glaciecola sp. MH2013]|uniref:flagellar basal body rod protein FlgB n=1 Tax=Glaciecola sp. MH2013 TaxID=2785524 RepID=UPI00189ECCBD|nr:flagellar basal body rod protein FlgB [Glaciecola sp. MH2013]MBF7072325.1 flagellar basal body rod protein FlgB [Glaciecola sp. MH2013]
MAISLDRLVGFHQKALSIRSDRMEVIAGNLANANTPGYKARDIDFNKAMKSAQYNQGSMTQTHEKHFAGKSQMQGEIEFRVPDQPDTGDGNTVDAQVERNNFLDNGMRYQAGIMLLNGKIKGMKKALSGGGQG